MKKLVLTVVFFFFAMLITNIICFAHDAAMVIDFKRGEAHYEAGEKKGEKVTLADFLNPGDKIRLEPGTSLVLNYFDSGVTEKITGSGHITIGKKCSKKVGNVRIRTSKSDYLPPKALLSRKDIQRSAAVPLRDSESKVGKIRVLTLLENTVVRSGKPVVFRWKPVKDAEKYDLSVSDIMKKEVFKASTPENSFNYDASDLGHDEIYDWKVSVTVNGKAFEGEGSFSILNKDDLNKVIMAEKKIMAKYPKDSKELLLRFAMVYRYYELNDEWVDGC